MASRSGDSRATLLLLGPAAISPGASEDSHNAIASSSTHDDTADPGDRHTGHKCGALDDQRGSGWSASFLPDAGRLRADLGSVHLQRSLARPGQHRSRSVVDRRRQHQPGGAGAGIRLRRGARRLHQRQRRHSRVSRSWRWMGDALHSSRAGSAADHWTESGARRTDRQGWQYRHGGVPPALHPAGRRAGGADRVQRHAHRHACREHELVQHVGQRRKADERQLPDELLHEF
jgi:hypothetical protein